MQMGHVMVQDYYRPDTANGYARGFILLSYMMTPVTYANLSGSFYGRELKDFLYDYSCTAAWWACAEGLPHEGNAVSLDPEVKDARGLPVARLTYEWGENDLKLAAAARDKAAEMMSASGARAVRIGLNYGAHAMGSCRMGEDAARSVVDPFGRAHDIPNLFICDTSVFVTGAGVNPTLTAMALAARSAEHMAESVRQGRALKEGHGRGRRPSERGRGPRDPGERHHSRRRAGRGSGGGGGGPAAGGEGWRAAPARPSMPRACARLGRSRARPSAASRASSVRPRCTICSVGSGSRRPPSSSSSGWTSRPCI